MAESSLAESTPGTPPTGLVAASVTLPNSPTSVIPTTVEVAKFLKPESPRKRRRSASDLPSPIDTSSLRASPSPVSPQGANLPRYPKALKGAAAMTDVAADVNRRRGGGENAECRQTSPNPIRNAIGALLATQSNSISKSGNATNIPKTATDSVPAVALPTEPPGSSSIKVPETSPGENTVQTSPVSISSFGTLESAPTGALHTNGASVASPGQIEESLPDEDGTPSRHVKNGTPNNNPQESDEGRSNKALSFPGPLLSTQVGADPRRGMSLPHSGLGSPRSPSMKKHKCPYCSTDFTRHHNLKSHLLTHSHEKPYLCETCDSRFRRLHDLKRHTKLHTGERPHVCLKCDRSFARGDALARHNKGQGGCAGRRSSMGSFGGDDKIDERIKGAGQDDSMAGLVYTGEASHEPERMDEDPKSYDPHLPSIRKHNHSSEPYHVQHLPDPHSPYQQRTSSSTYPPVASGRQPSLYPPNASHGGGSGTSATPDRQSSVNQYPGDSRPFQTPVSNVFSQGGMTESPKPLSPGGHTDAGNRNRSPSLNQPFQPPQFTRRPTNHNASPPMGLPPPIAGSNHSNAPHLPSLPGLPDPRFTLISHGGHPNSQGSHPPGPTTGPSHSSSAGGIGSPRYHPQAGNNTSSNNNSLSSHGTVPHGSGEHNRFGASSEKDLWAHIRGLEAKVNRLEDEVVSLKSQLNAPPHR